MRRVLNGGRAHSAKYCAMLECARSIDLEGSVLYLGLRCGS